MYKEMETTQPFELAIQAHQRYLLKASSKDLYDAINNYIAAVKSNPDVSETYYRLARLLHESGQIGLHAAIEQCEAAVKIDPKNANAHMYLGYFLTLEGNIDKAKEHFEGAIKLKPLSSGRARMVLAMTLLENKKDAKSIAQALYCLLSGSLLFLGDATSMKVLVKSVANDISAAKSKLFGGLLEKLNCKKKAYRIYRDALDNGKDAPELYRRMGKIAAKEGHPEIAQECYRDAVIVSNKSPESLISAIEFTQQHYPDNVDELLDYYVDLTFHNPDFSRCYYDMGHLYLKKGETINALNAFTIALEKDKNNPFYQNSLAFAYVQLEQYDLALELYKKAYEANPDNEWSALVAQAMAAIYHQIKGNPETALSIIQSAIHLTKNKSQMYLAMADIYYDLEDSELAAKYYALALEGEAGNSRAHSRLAMVFWEKDEIELAIVHYSKAIDLDPEYDIAYNNLGVVFLDGLNDCNRAIAYFETAIDIDPDYVLAHFNCARAYEALGKKLEAANMYQKALDLNELNPEIESELIEKRLFGLFDT